MGKKNAPQNWITERLEKHNADRRAALKAKGYKELFVFPRGTTEIIVDADKEPRDIPTKNGLRVVFSIKVKGQEKDLMVNPVSALYRGILLSLNNGITKISVTRTGEKKETRYDIA